MVIVVSCAPFFPRSHRILALAEAYLRNKLSAGWSVERLSLAIGWWGKNEQLPFSNGVKRKA